MSDLFAPIDSPSSALLSACGTYRYRLERWWDRAKPAVAFIMLNPSTADAMADDPTIRRCIAFGKSWGFGGLIVGNLFALRSTDPVALYSHPLPVGDNNDEHLTSIAQSAGRVVCAWGTHGTYRNRGRDVARLLECYPLVALKVTKAGHPGHPLYVASATTPLPYRAVTEGVV